MNLMSTGMVRPVDKMGRVVIPKEIREHLGIENDKDSFEIYMNGKYVILKKFEPTCTFCGNLAECVEYHGIVVCKKCIKELEHLAEITPL